MRARRIAPVPIARPCLAELHRLLRPSEARRGDRCDTDREIRISRNFDDVRPPRSPGCWNSPGKRGVPGDLAALDHQDCGRSGNQSRVRSSGERHQTAAPSLLSSILMRKTVFFVVSFQRRVMQAWISFRVSIEPGTSRRPYRGRPQLSEMSQLGGCSLSVPCPC